MAKSEIVFQVVKKVFLFTILYVICLLDKRIEL